MAGVTLQQAQHGPRKDAEPDARLLAHPPALPRQRLLPQQLRRNLHRTPYITFSMSQMDTAKSD